MSFKEDFKALLEELVLPEMNTLKSQISEIHAELCSDTDSLKSDIRALHRSRIERMDVIIESIQGLSKQVRSITSSLRD